jgi:hypothetical protein
MVSNQIQERLDEVRKYVERSRVSAEEAKVFLDVGYPTRLKRDKAVEELQIGLEQLADVVEQLAEQLEKNKKGLLPFRLPFIG